MKAKYYISIFVGLLLFAGCTKDYLELENPNLQTTATFWQTEEDVRQGVSATYMGLLYDGTYMRFLPFALNLKGDDCYSLSGWPVLSLTGKFNVFYTDPIMVQWPWTSLFGVNNRANQVLANIGRARFEDSQKYNQYKGEALFLRAFSNYNLVNFYRNIPLVLRPFESNDMIYPSQSSPEEVWNSIINDFEQAAALLPETYPSTDVGRATKGAALAFLGKSYLINKNYEKAAVYLKQVIDMEEIYELVPNYEDNFTTTNENNKESIFEVQLDRNVGGTVLGWVSEPAPDWSKTTAHAVTFAPTPYGFGDVTPTRWIFDEFFKEKTVAGEVDPRLFSTLNFDTTLCVLYGLPFREAYADDTTRWRDISVRKYTNAFLNDRVNEHDWRSDINERVMRFAEVLMMYAECLYENGDPTGAASYIQMVRDRVELPDIRTQIAAMDRDEFYSQLSHDKALEFALEGVRFEDLKRWGWLYDADRLEELKSHDTEFETYSPGREFFPIPPAELDKNSNYTNNPGW